MEYYKNRNIIILLILSLSISLFYCFFFPSVVENDPDQIQYHTIAQNLAKHSAFSIEKEIPFHPSIAREPLYPFFLAIIYKLFGDSFLTVRVIQAILFSFSIVLIYVFISKLVNNNISFYSSVFVIFCPPLANQTSYLLSETLFIFLLLIYIYSLHLMINLKKDSLFVINGFLLGLLTLCKVMMSFFLIFLILYIVISKYKKSAIMLLIISLLIPLSPWIYRNHSLFGTYKITIRGGKLFYNKAMRLDFGFNEYMQSVIYYFSEGMGKMIYPDAIIKNEYFMNQFNSLVKGRDDEKIRRDNIKNRNFSIKESLIIEFIVDDLRKKGLTEIEIDDILAYEGLKKIKNHPIKYLLQTPLELIKMTAFVYLPLLNEEYVVSTIDSFKNGLVFIIRGIIRLIAYPILVLAFYGAYQYRSKWGEFLSVLMVIAYFNLFYGLTFGWGRYSVPLIPFYIMFATMGWFKLKERKNIISGQQSMCIL